MKYYFSLQWKMLNRQLIDFGVNPVFGWAGVVLVFLIVSDFLFGATEFAPWIFSGGALFWGSKLSEKSRNDFLKSCFKQADYRKVRMVENGILSAPFALYLLFEGEPLIAGGLVIIAVFLALINFRQDMYFVVPTPFARRPFEFVAGFRKTFLVFPLMYFCIVLTGISKNFDLGMMALVLTIFTCLSYYSEAEDEFLVWIFAKTPVRFIWSKIGTAIFNLTLICLPILIPMIILFPEKIYVLLGFQVLGFVYISTVVLAKYSSFPLKLEVPQSMLLTLGLFFPPLMLAIAPFFYMRSLRKMKMIL